jgi:hypothetical protein
VVVVKIIFPDFIIKNINLYCNAFLRNNFLRIFITIGIFGFSDASAGKKFSLSLKDHVQLSVKRTEYLYKILRTNIFRFHSALIRQPDIFISAHGSVHTFFYGFQKLNFPSELFFHFFFIKQIKVSIFIFIFNFKINLFSPTPWYCPFAVSGKFLRMGEALGNSLTLNRLRTKEGFKAQTNGNHFSFVMTPEQISDKLQAYSHVEFNDPKYLDPAAIAQAVAENRDICERDRMKYLIPVEMDETWPLAMLEGLEKWAPFIAKPACKISALKLPEVSLHPMPDVEVDFYKEVNDLPS